MHQKMITNSKPFLFALFSMSEVFRNFFIGLINKSHDRRFIVKCIQGTHYGGISPPKVLLSKNKNHNVHWGLPIYSTFISAFEIGQHNLKMHK